MQGTIKKNKTLVSKYLTRKKLIGLILGLILGIIVLNVDKKLWFPLELETLNGRNISCFKEKLNYKKNTSKIVVILFDDKTQFLLRKNSMPIKDFEKNGKDLIGSAVEKLENFKVKSIGLNLNLSSQSNQESSFRLMKILSQYKNIVIAESLYGMPSSLPEGKSKSPSKFGYGELFAEYDKIVHKIKLVEDNVKPSFSYALYKVITKNEIDSNLKGKNEFFLKYNPNDVAKYSFIDLVQGRISKDSLKDKIVILGIGLNSKLIKDGLLSPFNKKDFISDSEIQALALSNLLDKSYLFKFSFSKYPIVFVIFSMFLGTFFSSLTTLRRLFLSLVLLFLTLFYTQVLYNHYQLAVEVVPMISIILGNLIIGSFIFLQLDLQEQNIELEHAFKLITNRSKELESSQSQLQNRNVQLTNALGELNVKINELKEVRKQLSNRGEEERKRIARDLHDDTLARITDVKRHIESIIHSKDLSIAYKKELGACIQTMDNITHEVRRIINALRPSMLDNVLGLIPAIENLLDELTKRSNHKIQTKFNSSINDLQLEDSIEINLYRIIQEALNNIFKHSNASKVEIQIIQQPGQILFIISDNGIGINQSRDIINNVSKGKSGFGLIDMKERAELIGAKVQYLNKPDGAGTTLEIILPVKQYVTK